MTAICFILGISVKHVRIYKFNNNIFAEMLTSFMMSDVCKRNPNYVRRHLHFPTERTTTD
jgi:hypothetical protein